MKVITYKKEDIDANFNFKIGQEVRIQTEDGFQFWYTVVEVFTNTVAIMNTSNTKSITLILKQRLINDVIQIDEEVK